MGGKKRRGRMVRMQLYNNETFFSSTPLAKLEWNNGRGQWMEFSYPSLNVTKKLKTY